MRTIFNRECLKKILMFSFIFYIFTISECYAEYSYRSLEIKSINLEELILFVEVGIYFIIIITKYIKKMYIKLDIIAILLMYLIGKKGIIGLLFVNIIIFIIVFVMKVILDKRRIDLSNKKISFILNIMIIILFLSNLENCLIINPKVYFKERDWAFGETIDKRKYSINIDEYEEIEGTISNEVVPRFKIKNIDFDGVTIEYWRKYYEIKENEDNYSEHIKSFYDYDIKSEIVQQKMKWNVNYEFEYEKNPVISYDGGTDYVIRFEK